jgi:hypothetical protein
MPPVRNWFDPRNRGPASEYGDDLPTEEVVVVPAQPAVAQGEIYTLRNRRLADALAEQPLTEYGGGVVAGEAGEGPVPSAGPTEGELAHERLMQIETERQRQEALSTFQKLQAAYRQLFNRR